MINVNPKIFKYLHLFYSFIIIIILNWTITQVQSTLILASTVLERLVTLQELTQWSTYQADCWCWYFIVNPQSVAAVFTGSLSRTSLCLPCPYLALHHTCRSCKLAVLWGGLQAILILWHNMSWMQSTKTALQLTWRGTTSYNQVVAKKFLNSGFEPSSTLQTRGLKAHLSLF